MRVSIERYFQALQKVIAASSIVAISDISFEKRSDHVGFVRGNLTFVNGSQLHLRELVDVRQIVTRSMYVYHYQRADGSFVFRYDNARHFHQLPNFPHHRHAGDEDNVAASHAPTLAEILTEVESSIDPSQ